jgi:hypothetical protein
MKPSTLRTLCICVASFFFSTAANAGLIDFETILGGAPVDGQTIDTQFLASDGVTFSLVGGGAPVLAQIGAPTTAFLGAGGGDTPIAADAGAIGQFFLTDDGLTQGTVPGALLVNYSAPTANASGVVLDIDGGETFLIEAFDGVNGAGTLLSTFTINAGDADTGNGVATDWFFSLGSATIRSIIFSGSRPSGFFGLGFDNFDTGVDVGVVPLPAALPLYGTGLALMGFIGWRRRQRKVV